jgi:hypothetical protein
MPASLQELSLNLSQFSSVLAVRGSSDALSQEVQETLLFCFAIFCGMEYL